MAVEIQKVSYYYTMVPDRPGEAYGFLSRLAAKKVNLLAFHSVPMGPHTQLVLFPEDPYKLTDAADREGFDLTGPEHALLVQGDDELGALIDIHCALADAQVNAYASNGVSSGKGGFGYIIHVRADDLEKAALALNAS